MGAALALASRGRGRCAPNPNVGCLIVKAGRVVGRGWTQPGGRPHAEAMALAQAGAAAAGAEVFVTLEPCAHASERGPACADLLVSAAPARVVVALRDPDPRTDGKGLARLRAAKIETVDGVRAAEAEAMAGGFFARRRRGRPHVTLKLALSLDGRIALGDGTSRWITGAPARALAHLERSRAELVVIGAGTFTADAPRLDVRLAGLADRSPRGAVLTRGTVPDGWVALAAPADIARLERIDEVLVEGGGETAAAFLAEDLVDRLMIHRAPIMIGGEGRPGIGALALDDLASAHGRWRAADVRTLGSDRIEVYERVRS